MKNECSAASQLEKVLSLDGFEDSAGPEPDGLGPMTLPHDGEIISSLSFLTHGLSSVWYPHRSFKCDLLEYIRGKEFLW